MKQTNLMIISFRTWFPKRTLLQVFKQNQYNLVFTKGQIYRKVIAKISKILKIHNICFHEQGVVLMCFL